MHRHRPCPVVKAGEIDRAGAGAAVLEHLTLVDQVILAVVPGDATGSPEIQRAPRQVHQPALIRDGSIVEDGDRVVRQVDRARIGQQAIQAQAARQAQHSAAGYRQDAIPVDSRAASKGQRSTARHLETLHPGTAAAQSKARHDGVLIVRDRISSCRCDFGNVTNPRRLVGTPVGGDAPIAAARVGPYSGRSRPSTLELGEGGRQKRRKNSHFHIVLLI